MNARYIGSTEVNGESFRCRCMNVHHQSFTCCTSGKQPAGILYRAHRSSENSNRTTSDHSSYSIFHLWQRDTFSGTILHVDIPRYYRWKNTKFGVGLSGAKRWMEKRCSKEMSSEESIQLTQDRTNIFYLGFYSTISRVQKLSVLKVFNDVLCVAYREACQMKGLLEYDRVFSYTSRNSSQCLPSSITYFACHHPQILRPK